MESENMRLSPKTQSYIFMELSQNAVSGKCRALCNGILSHTQWGIAYIHSGTKCNIVPPNLLPLAMNTFFYFYVLQSSREMSAEIISQIAEVPERRQLLVAFLTRLLHKVRFKAWFTYIS